MKRHIALLLFVLLLSATLFGCSSGRSEVDSALSDAKIASESPKPEPEKLDDSQSDISIPESPKVEASEQEKVEEIDYSIPSDFVDYRKFIGSDISVLEVDTSIWDSGDYSHDLWGGSCYGHTGTISVRLGWDDQTIIEFFLRLDENDKISDEEREKISQSVIEIFGSEISESSVSMRFSGKGDYEFAIPMPIEQTGCFMLSWNSDVLSDYIHSKPKEEPSPTPSTKPELPPKEEPKIGMTADEVRSSTWGSPSEINRTTTQYGVREQWVYHTYSKTKYIYLEDGFVTAIQD